MARVASRWARGTVTPEAAAHEMATLGAAVEKALGDMGKDERDVQECLVVSHLGTAAQSEAIVRRTSTSNALLGGCRFRVGQELLRQGKAAQAALELERALKDIIWGRFLYQDLVAKTMLAYGRAAHKNQNAAVARDVLTRIRTNFRRAEIALPEAAEAGKLLTQLQ